MTKPLDAQIREWAEVRRLPASHLEGWLRLPEDDRNALLEVADKVRMRTGQFVVAFGLLEEIAARDRAAVAAILERPHLRRIIEGNGSAPSKAAALIEALRALRYPQLHGFSSQLSYEIARLRLPSAVRVALPSDLNSDELRVELIVHSGEELGRLLDALSHARADLCRIVDALGGADDV